MWTVQQSKHVRVQCFKNVRLVCGQAPLDLLHGWLSPTTAQLLPVSASCPLMPCRPPPCLPWTWHRQRLRLPSCCRLLRARQQELSDWAWLPPPSPSSCERTSWLPRPAGPFQLPPWQPVPPFLPAAKAEKVARTEPCSSRSQHKQFSGMVQHRQWAALHARLADVLTHPSPAAHRPALFSGLLLGILCLLLPAPARQ